MELTEKVQRARSEIIGMDEEKEHQSQKRGTRKQTLFIERYLIHFNASRAAREAGYSAKTAYAIGNKLLKKAEVKDAIEEHLKASQLETDAALKILADQATANLADFFKVVTEWTFHPLPTYEIIDTEEVIDASEQGEPKTRVKYLARHIALDMDKLVDPAYAHLLREFSDSPKSGLSIKLHDKQTAIDKILRVKGVYRDTVNANVLDLSKLTDSQLERLAKGEDVYSVLAGEGPG